MEMLPLFTDAGVAPDGGNDYGAPCARPDIEPSSAYRYGCRCPRCVRWKSRTRAQEMAAGLVGPPVCKIDGCNNPKRRVSGAKYCEEHATSLNYRLTGKQYRPTHTCIGCGRDYQGKYAGATQSTYKVCPPCRQRSTALLARARLHGVPPEVVARWLTDPLCDLCSSPLYLGKGRGGSQGFCIDHDHAHCDGITGCAECVRGLLCNRCNTRLGAYEALARDVGLGAVAGYLQEASFK